MKKLGKNQVLSDLRTELRYIDKRITVKRERVHGKVVVTFPDDDAAWVLVYLIANGWA